VLLLINLILLVPTRTLLDNQKNTIYIVNTHLQHPTRKRPALHNPHPNVAKQQTPAPR
jgi:hypothetical protein